MNRSRWRERLPRVGVETALRPWLREPHSLTARLQRHGRFRVRLLQQRLAHANGDEAGLLGVGDRDPCWVREVVLHCDEAPVVFAHTVLPQHPRGVLHHWFARLGTRSLGSLLFAHPGFRRGRLSYARLDPQHPLYAAAAAVLGVRPPAFAARRCLHCFRRQVVLVTEVFSPALADFRPLAGA